MEYIKRQLLCTFCNYTDYKKTVNEIVNFYKLKSQKIFIFSNKKNEKELYITYNVYITDESYKKYQNTISIHRKKQTNTLYTLNSLNKIIMDENGGVLDKKYQIQWDLYENCLIITVDDFIKIIPIKLFDIIN